MGLDVLGKEGPLTAIGGDVGIVEFIELEFVWEFWVLQLGRVFEGVTNELRFLFLFVITTTGWGTKWGLVLVGCCVWLITILLLLELENGMDIDCDREADGAEKVLVLISKEVFL